MRGVAMLTGKYPAEGQMYMWIWNGQILQQSKGFYIYFAAFLVLYLCSQRL